MNHRPRTSSVPPDDKRIARKVQDAGLILSIAVTLVVSVVGIAMHFH